MGWKSTIFLNRVQALQIAARELGCEDWASDDIDRLITQILEKATDYENQSSKYYWHNFWVRETVEDGANDHLTLP